MLPPSEQDMELLIRDLDALEKEFKDTKLETESLKALLAVEVQNCQAAETLCASLEEEKLRLLKFQEEYLAQTIQQLDYKMKYESLWQEVKLRNEQDNAKEKEHERVIATLKEKLQITEQELDNRIRHLESQLCLKDSSVVQLEQEIAQLHENMDILHQNLEQTQKNERAEFEHEVEKLKREVLAAQEANQKLHDRLQKQEQSSMLQRTKLEAQLQDLSSNWHVGALKQKVMKLRKENEDLKRQLLQVEDLRSNLYEK